MNHYSMELLARERIQTFHREAAYKRPHGASGPVARSIGAFVERLVALHTRLTNVRKTAVAGQLSQVGHRRTAEAQALSVEAIPDA